MIAFPCSPSFHRRIPARLVAFLLLIGGPTACAPEPFPPCHDCNVVLISVDTLRADHVGAYGYPRPTTPNIDALARRGVLFENAISQSSWTRPAHMSIFTGLHPREHGFIALMDSRPLDNGVPTLASELGRHGWATAGFSGGVNMAAAFGFGRGFEVYRNNGKFFRDNFEDMRYWLDRNQGRRFFLFFHGYDAHTPYRGDGIDRRAIGLLDPPPTYRMRRACKSGTMSKRMSAFVDEYDAAVRRADRYVGKLVADLERRGLMSRTILILLSDHGEEFLEHGRCFHISTLHREVLHVPLLVVAPGLAPRHVPEPVPASVSVAPTIMALVGVPSHPFPGPSLLAAARGLGVPSGPIVSETERAQAGGGDGHVRSLTGGDFKFIHWSTRNRAALYDSVTDSDELHNSADASQHDRFAGTLARWADAHPPRFPPRRRAKSGASSTAAAAAGEAMTTPARPENAGQEDQGDEELRRREQQLRSLGYTD